MDFRQLQRAFAAHLRDPDIHPAPAGVEDRRMAVYRDLFFNNLRDLLAGTFPVCREILGDEGWSALVRAFYSGHKAHTPYFTELPREFVEWLSAIPDDTQVVPAFLPELAHYEWVELALSITDAAAPDDGVDPRGDLLSGRPVLSPLAWPLAYRWPVHRLSVDYQPQHPPALPTFIVVHRRDDGRVGFLQVDAPTARLLELLDTDVRDSGRALLEQVAAEVSPQDRDALVERGTHMLARLRERGILSGTITPA